MMAGLQPLHGHVSRVSDCGTSLAAGIAYSQKKDLDYCRHQKWQFHCCLLRVKLQNRKL